MRTRRGTTLLILAAALPMALAACGTETTESTESTESTGSTVATGAPVVDDARTPMLEVAGEWVPESVMTDGQSYDRPDQSSDALVTIEPAEPNGAEGGDSGVYAGCNHTGADVRIDGDRLRVGDLVSTMMGCEGEVGSFEEDLVDIFTSDPRFEISDSGDALVLTADNGDYVTLKRA